MYIVIRGYPAAMPRLGATGNHSRLPGRSKPRPYICLIINALTALKAPILNT